MIAAQGCSVLGTTGRFDEGGQSELPGPAEPGRGFNDEDVLFLHSDGKDGQEQPVFYGHQPGPDQPGPSEEDILFLPLGKEGNANRSTGPAYADNARANPNKINSEDVLFMYPERGGKLSKRGLITSLAPIAALLEALNEPMGEAVNPAAARRDGEPQKGLDAQELQDRLVGMVQSPEVREGVLWEPTRQERMVAVLFGFN